MPGLFISKGMGLQIPPGGLTISIGPDGQPTMSVEKVEVSLDFWDHWLEVGRASAVESYRLWHETLKAHQAEDESLMSDRLGEAMRASLTCMGALGCSFDALYSSVKERLPKSVVDKIGGKDWPRHRYVHETLRRASRLNNKESQLAQSIIKQVFYFRDSAVHPPGGWAEPAHQPELDVFLPVGYSNFSAANAVKGYFATQRVIETILKQIRPKFGDLASWSEGALDRLPDPLPVEIVRVKDPAEDGSHEGDPSSSPESGDSEGSA